MAGIGFALKKLSQSDNLSGRTLAGAHAIMVTSGPWIVIMAGLALVSFLGVPVVGQEATVTFRILLIYNFAIALVITAPISLEVTLRISSLMFERRFTEVQAVYFAALIITTGISAVAGSVIFFALLKLPTGVALAAVFCTIQVSLMWISMSMITAIRQYTVVSFAFAIGLSIGVTLSITLASIGYGVAGLLAGFGCGLCVAFTILNSLIIQTFPGRLIPLSVLLRQMLTLRSQSKVFLLAGVASAIAVWIDKVVVWQSSEAIVLAEGVLHAPRYDVPMFIAFLSIIPMISVITMWLDTVFFTSYRLYCNIVCSGGTLRQIDAHRERLAKETTRKISAAFILQVTVSVLLAILSPLLIRMLGLPVEALHVLRLALIGAAFHFLFLACCGVILFVRYEKMYLNLQMAFVLANGGLTAIFLVNPNLLGLGYVSATAICAVIAYAALLRTMGMLNQLTFIDNNPSIYK